MVVADMNAAKNLLIDGAVQRVNTSRLRVADVAEIHRYGVHFRASGGGVSGEVVTL